MRQRLKLENFIIYLSFSFSFSFSFSLSLACFLFYLCSSSILSVLCHWFTLFSVKCCRYFNMPFPLALLLCLASNNFKQTTKYKRFSSFSIFRIALAPDSIDRNFGFEMKRQPKTTRVQMKNLVNSEVFDYADIRSLYLVAAGAVVASHSMKW